MTEHRVAALRDAATAEDGIGAAGFDIKSLIEGVLGCDAWLSQLTSENTMPVTAVEKLKVSVIAGAPVMALVEAFPTTPPT